MKRYVTPCAVCDSEFDTDMSLCNRCATALVDGVYFAIGDFCDHCPLTNNDEFGLHCNAAQEGRTLDEREVESSRGSWARGRWPRPDWCPLRKGGVIVVEATKEEREAERCE